MFDRFLNALRLLPLRLIGQPAEGSPAAEFLTAEKVLATAQATGTIRFLPHVDQVVEETADMRRAYRQMLREPYIKAPLFQKVLSVAAQDIQVHPDGDSDGDKMAADFARRALARVRGGMRAVARSVLMHGLMDGFSVCEKVWRVEEHGRLAGKVVLHRLKAKDTEFAKPEGDNYKNVTSIYDTRTGKRWHVDNFALWSHMPLFESPTGLSDFRAAYRAFWLMDTAWKLRAVGLERFTLPMLKGSYESPDQKVPLELAMKLARAQGWVSLPHGAQMEAMELATKSASDFAQAIADLRAEMFIAIAGAMLHAMEGQNPGANGSSAAHKDAAELLTWYLAAELADVLNDQVVPFLIDFNFAPGSVGYPTVTFGSISDAAMAASLTIDEGLLRNGLPLSRKEIYARYGRSEPIDQADALLPPTAAPALPGLLSDAQAGTAGAGAVPAPAGTAGAATPDGATGQPAPAVATNDLRASVGGSQAIAALQQAFYAGSMPREAAIANAELVFGFTPEEASRLFPDKPPEPPAPAPGQPGSPGVPVVEVKGNPGGAPPASPAPAAGGQPAPAPFDEPAAPVAGAATPATKPTGPAPRKVADAGATDAQKVAKLLNTAAARGRQVLADITRAALERHLDEGGKLDYSAAEYNRLVDSLAEIAGTARLMGRARIRIRADQAERLAGARTFSDEPTDFEVFDVSVGSVGAVAPMPPAQAVAYFNRLVPTLGIDPHRFGPLMERHAFTMAAATSQTMLGRVQSILSGVLTTGRGTRQAVYDIDTILDKAGVSVANPQYSEMVVRTNLMDSYNIGSDEELKEVADTFPAWRYSGIRDGRQGKDHEPHFGRYFASKLSFVEVRGERPYNCRCTMIPVDKWELPRLLKSGVKIEGL